MSQKKSSGVILGDGRVPVFSLLIILIPILPLVMALLLWVLDMLTFDENYSLLSSIANHTPEILVLSVVVWGLLFYFIAQQMSIMKPKKRNQVASQEWIPVESHGKDKDGNDLKSQEKFFSSAPIDTSVKLEVGGAPVNKVGDKLLYETYPVHDLCVGSTRSGKSRKIVRQLVMLASMADEAMFFNDPKKEMYQDFHKYLEKKGYDVYCLDFRNPEYSHQWNPLADITYMFKLGKIDDADQYASDQVSSLVVDNGKSEAIWIDGQKALIKSLILEVCQAPISDDKKNYYSVFQMMSLLGGEVKIDGKGKMLLSAYMESLEETSPSRIAYTPIANSPDKTRGSFMTSAVSTLSPFSQRKLMKVLSDSQFDVHTFTEGKKAVFVVNPDEKNTYDAITAMFFDSVYQILIFEANKMSGRKLKKRVHMIYDEFGNMPLINSLETKITVALSRQVIYHLYLQDFKQMNQKYGQDVAAIIRGNCNLNYFISSADFDTCEEMSRKFGEHDVWVDSYSGNMDNLANVTGGGVSYAVHQKRLIDANELLNHNGADTGDIFVHRTYLGACRVNLPDCTKYSWFKEMEHDEVEVENKDLSLHFAVPRYIHLTEAEIRALFGAPAPQPVQPSHDLKSKMAMAEERRRTGVSPMGPSGAMYGKKAAGQEALTQQGLYWYWAENNTLGERVKEHVIERIVKEGNPNFDVKAYMKSPEFTDWVQAVDKNESGTDRKEKIEIAEKLTGVKKSYDILNSELVEMMNP